MKGDYTEEPRSYEDNGGLRPGNSSERGGPTQTIEEETRGGREVGRERLP